MKPFFTICAACCDVAPFLRECFDSLLGQSFADWECVAFVEESKDETEAIAREYAARDPRFRVLTGPRSGSCSVPRNEGVANAQGEYVIFLDGDDTLVPGGLQRIRDKIAACPGADLYPCAVAVHNDMTGRDETVRDNYPVDFGEELTGPKATVFIAEARAQPEPMMQMTVCRRVFLIENNLKCVAGLRGQDREFSPRALYLAKRVVPIHEPFYLYRKRSGAVTTSVPNDRLLVDQAIIHKSLLSFFGRVRRDPEFDGRVAARWCRCWTNWIFYAWFSPRNLDHIARSTRTRTLELLFEDGYGDFDALLKHASAPRRIAGWWFAAFTRTPCLKIASELFFRCYFFLSGLKRR